MVTKPAGSVPIYEKTELEEDSPRLLDFSQTELEEDQAQNKQGYSSYLVKAYQAKTTVYSRGW